MAFLRSTTLTVLALLVGITSPILAQETCVEPDNDFLSSIGAPVGELVSMTIDPPYLYAGGILFGDGAGGRLVVYDISSPHVPVELGHMDVSSHMVTDIDRVGNLLHITNCCTFYNTGHYVVDITNPANPFPIGSYIIHGYWRVAAQGDYAVLVTSFDGWVVHDVTDPADPQVCYVGFSGSVRDVDYVGDRAYIAADIGMRIYDMTTPCAPVLLGEHALSYTNSRAMGVLVDGTTAFVADTDHCDIVDVSDPAHPALVTEFGHAGRLSLDGSRLSIRDADEVHVYDVSDIASPRHVDSIVTLSENRVPRAVLNGDVGYVSDFDWRREVRSEIRTFEISRFRDSGFTANGELPRTIFQLAQNGGNVYGRSHQDIVSVDTEDPASSTVVPHGLNYSSRDMTVSDDHLFVLGHGVMSAVFDISAPQSPLSLGLFPHLPPGQEGYGRAIESRRDLLYLAYIVPADTIPPSDPLGIPKAVGQSYLAVHDVSGGVPSGAISTTPIPWEPRTMRLEGDHLYLAGGSGTGIAVYDVADSTAPFFTGAEEYLDFGLPTALAISGDRLYAAASSFLFTYDLTDPGDPAWLGATLLESSTTRPALARDSHVYVATTGLGIQIYEDDRSALPVRVGWLDGGDFAPHLAVDLGDDWVVSDGTFVGRSTLPCREATVSVDEPATPRSSLVLHRATPNPFNPTTVLAFTTSVPQHVSLEVFDVRGRLVRTLVDGDVDAGLHRFEWNGRDDRDRIVASGVYLYRLSGAVDVRVGKLALLK